MSKRQTHSSAPLGFRFLKVIAMLKTFPGKVITQLRGKASRAARAPEDCPDGWSISAVDPMAVLAVFKPLRLKDGFVLRAYQFREGGNGNAFVWAMPVDADFPDPEECPRLEGVFLEPPKPPLALDHVMDAIDGDRSPWSYMCASILARELGEFGAMWHGCNWSTHTVLGANPWNPTRRKKKSGVVHWMSPLTEWVWAERSPKAWSPSVDAGEATTVVTFYTFSQLGQEAIYRHTDTYEPGSYRFYSERATLATGPDGYVH